MARTLHPLVMRDRAEFSLTATFVEGRLEKRETVEWALEVPAGARREAVVALAHGARDTGMREPWRTVWNLVEEFWRKPPQPHGPDGLHLHDIEQRARRGELTGALITDIADYLCPRLRLEPIELRAGSRPHPKAPYAVTDIVHVTITSELAIDPRVVRLEQLSDSGFLAGLARALEVDIDYGLDLGRRLGWSFEREPWRFGTIHRVYFVRDTEGEEPDEFERGLVPAVKLLHAAVDRLAQTEPKIARGLVHGWLLRDSQLYRRLWAALSFRRDVTPGNEVGAFLESLTTDQFWDLHQLPEFTELRARRFTDLPAESQRTVLHRLRRGPPPKRWSERLEHDRLEEVRKYWKARELRRIEIGGAIMPPRDQDWLRRAMLDLPELADMGLKRDFLPGVQVHWREADPDRSLDGLSGRQRLAALERALNANSAFRHDPAQRAEDWIRADQNILSVLQDFEALGPDEPANYPTVWDRFGWTHTPTSRSLTPEQRQAESDRVIRLLWRLPRETVERAIEGLTSWMGSWATSVQPRMAVAPLWFKVWPIAVDVTNQQSEDVSDLSVVVRQAKDREPKELDTLNTPAGRLAGAFIVLCPDLNNTARPFESIPELRQMREFLDAAPGRSGTIARYRLVENLDYFLAADEPWTNEHLVSLLEQDTSEALILWRAAVRRGIYPRAARRLAEQMITRVTDTRLDRETRKGLIFAIVVEGIRRLVDGQGPGPFLPSVQQAIRMVEPEVRAHAAHAVSRIQKEWPSDRHPLGTAEDVYRRAIAPFMTLVWPQERSLASPGTASEFADVPAASKDEFSNAVRILTRFLVPFDCWSMADYGLREQNDDDEPLRMIDDAEKGGALIDLLDLTIGTADGAVVPYGLGRALQHIRNVAPRLAETPKYRRLAAAARL